MIRFIIKILTNFLMTAALFSQQVQLVVKQVDAADTLSVWPGEIDSILGSQLDAFSANGYWDARAELSPGGAGQGMLEAQIIPGHASSLRHIHFSGLEKGDANYLQKEFKMGRNSISSSDLTQAERRVSDLGYQLAKESHLSQDEVGEYHLNYRVKNHPELKAEGLASFNRSTDADTLAWYGQLHVNIPNFDGKGKSFDFSWQRLKSNSESFNLGLKLPWLFQLPMAGLFQFGREVIDGNYQIVQTRLGLEWSLDWERAIHFSYEKNESIITHEGSLQFPEWQPDKKGLLGLGFRQSSLDIQTHRGISLKTMLYQEVKFEPESISKFTLRSEARVKLLKRLYVSQRSAATIQNHINSQNDPSIQVPIGGVNSVRGYDEAYLRVPNAISMQNTLHFIIGNQSQILAFYDIGLHNNNKSINALEGYGLGIQLRSGRGPIRLILASHKGVKLSNSFFHIEYSGGISWIDR